MLPSAREAVAALPSLALAWPAWSPQIVSEERVGRSFPPRAQAQSADPTTNICVNIERCARTTQTHWRSMPFEMPHALGRCEEYQKWPPSLRVDAMMPDTEKT